MQVNLEKQNFDYSKLENKVKKISSKVSEYLLIFDADFIFKEIFKAYEYARDAHEWQVRLSWDPYIIHPVEATNILLSLHPDIFTIQACLLHDVVEDTPKTLKDIEASFWKEVAFLCSWMEKLSKVRYAWEDRNIWSLRKMFVAMAEDLRVVFIKLSDRLHNMQTLKFHPQKAKRERIALETLNIYAPIADRLWLFAIKNWLEEECFKILDPKAYKEVNTELKEIKHNVYFFLRNAENEIKELLESYWITKYKIDYRVKSVYSIYKKMQRKWIENAKLLFDIFWIRIMVSDIETCYKVLWIIHSKWTPLPNRFKDYIALPKPNWYKSLHTTVIGLLKKDTEQPSEIQIKTFEMLEYAEIWVAAHFEYKEKWSVIAHDIDWVKDLKELTENLENNDFMTSLKIDIFKDRIFVFTPKWKIINLPASSTPIDFAYYIHSDLWNHIAVAKVNSKVYPLDKELKNWDVIEIVTDKTRKPNPFRLSFVKTSKAKDRIRAFLKKEDESLHKERWRDIINKYLEKSGYPICDKELSIFKIIDWKHYSVDERWSLVEQVGNFSLTPSALLKRVFKDKKSNIEHKWLKKDFENTEESRDKEKKDLIIWWESGLAYKLCFCSRRKFPEHIVAHINAKWEITIHNRDCKVLKEVNRERLLPAFVKWTEKFIIKAYIKFIVKNTVWVLKDITHAIFEMNINVDEIHQSNSLFKEREIEAVLEIEDYDYFLIDRLVERIKFRLWDRIIWIEVMKID